MDAKLEPSRFALRFPRRLERKYQAYFAKHNVGYAQAAFASGIALFALYTYLDYILAPAMYEHLAVVRLAIMTPLCLLFLAFMFTRMFRMFMQPALAFICVMVALAFEERRHQLVYQARHDSLTQLPNRLATFEAVRTAIESTDGGSWSWMPVRNSASARWT